VYSEVWASNILTSLKENVASCASREVDVDFVSFLPRLLFASAAAFSNTATIGVSLAASFYCFLSTVTEVEGGGTRAVSSFIAPSSLGNIKRVKQTKYTKT
jgi:hypothetical protein